MVHEGITYAFCSRGCQEKFTQDPDRYLETDHQDNALLLPATYIVHREQETGVFVEVDETVSWRSITLGLRGREMVEVVKGLAAGDVIVRPLDPQTTLTAGRGVVTP